MPLQWESNFIKSGALSGEVSQTFPDLQHLSSESATFFSFCFSPQWGCVFLIVRIVSLPLQWEPDFIKSDALAREVLQTVFGLQHLSSESAAFFSFRLPLQWESMFSVVRTVSLTKLAASCQSDAIRERMYSASQACKENHAWLPGRSLCVALLSTLAKTIGMRPRSKSVRSTLFLGRGGGALLVFSV